MVLSVGYLNVFGLFLICARHVKTFRWASVAHLTIVCQSGASILSGGSRYCEQRDSNTKWAIVSPRNQSKEPPNGKPSMSQRK
eukprot:5540907-Amphidinium_carterae.2